MEIFKGSQVCSYLVLICCGLLWVTSFEPNKGFVHAVRTKGLPSPPRNPRYRIIGIEAFQIHVYWEAASFTGPLTTNYTVYYTPCYNKTLCTASEYVFCTIPHLPGKVHYHCQRPRDSIMSAIIAGGIIRDLFNVTIATVSERGVSKAPGFWVDADYLYEGSQLPFLPTPLPPKSLKVIAVGSDWIQLSWKQRTFKWEFYDQNYTIVYKDIADNNNEAIVKRVQNRERVTLKDGIEPYRNYSIQIRVELHYNNTKSGPSEFLGPKIVQTAEGEPFQGPIILMTKSHVYFNHPEERNVTITWEDPNISSWRGKPSHIKVYCRKIDNSLIIKKVSVIQDSVIPNTFTFTGLSSITSYYTYTRLCNSKGCGAMGPQKKIQAVSKELNKTEGEKKDGLVLEVVLFIIGFVLTGAGIVFGYLCYKRSRSKVKRSLDSEVNEMTIYQDNRYHDVGNLQDEHVYHTVNILNALHET